MDLTNRHDNIGHAETYYIVDCGSSTSEHIRWNGARGRPCKVSRLSSFKTAFSTERFRWPRRKYSHYFFLNILYFRLGSERSHAGSL